MKSSLFRIWQKGVLAGILLLVFGGTAFAAEVPARVADLCPPDFHVTYHLIVDRDVVFTAEKPVKSSKMNIQYEYRALWAVGLPYEEKRISEEMSAVKNTGPTEFAPAGSEDLEGGTVYWTKITSYYMGAKTDHAPPTVTYMGIWLRAYGDDRLLIKVEGKIESQDEARELIRFMANQTAQG